MPHNSRVDDEIRGLGGRLIFPGYHCLQPSSGRKPTHSSLFLGEFSSSERERSRLGLYTEVEASQEAPSFVPSLKHRVQLRPGLTFQLLWLWSRAEQCSGGLEGSANLVMGAHEAQRVCLALLGHQEKWEGSSREQSLWRTPRDKQALPKRKERWHIRLRKRQVHRYKW